MQLQIYTDEQREIFKDELRRAIKKEDEKILKTHRAYEKKFKDMKEAIINLTLDEKGLFDLWVKLEKAGTDLNAIISLPENFLRLRHYCIQDPDWFELNLFMESTPSHPLPRKVAIDLGHDHEEPSLDPPPNFRAKPGDIALAIRADGEWYPVELEDENIDLPPECLSFKSDQIQADTITNQSAESRKTISLTAMDKLKPDVIMQTAEDSSDSPGILESVRGAPHRDYYRVVFQFGTKALYERPIVLEEEVFVRFRNVITEIAPFPPFPG